MADYPCGDTCYARMTDDDGSRWRCLREKPCPLHDPTQPVDSHQERPAAPDATSDTHSTAEGATGGPGWDRDSIDTIADDMEAGGGVRNAAQVRALLADRDRLARALDKATAERRAAIELRNAAAETAEQARAKADEARQHATTDRRALLDMLALVSAERDRLRADIRLHRQTIDGRGSRIEELEKARDLHADRAARLSDDLDAARAEADQLRRDLSDLRNGAAADTIMRALTDRRVHIDVDLRVRPEDT